ncbi:aldehyde dehydrogenase family protein [Terasakiella sp.]|uniref:aldehyde dehydrogenase family protein n=1 Tax=Terasakiella sp. TaxID=2034861 RepID=UPI003AA9648F
MTEQTYALLIDGAQVATDDHFTVLNPANGQPVGHAPKASTTQLDEAVQAARTAFKKWSAVSDEERQQACLNIAAKIEEHSEELATLLTKEQGKPLNGLGSRFEIGGAKAWTQVTAALQVLPKVLQDTEEGKVVLHRKPIGVVGSITPWNWPVMIAIWHIIPAVRTGNTVVCKPSPFTPLSTIRLIELMNEVLPAGVVNCITGDDSLGAAMSTHQGIDKIVFTGSCATGQKVMMSAAATMKRLTLELGGNDAGIILPDCDPKEIAEGLFWGAFINNGQTCAAMKRLYVHESLHDQVCEELANVVRTIPMGDGLDEANVIGPIQNTMQFEKVKGLVEDAKRKGARILTGGEAGEGLFYPTTLIAGVDNGWPIVDEEQFGPVLPIISYRDIDEVIERANDSPNGLGGSVWSKDIEKAKEIASRLECGSVWINKHGAIQPNAPFGGVKGSGIGVEFGEEGLAEYTNIQVIFS